MNGNLALALGWLRRTGTVLRNWRPRAGPAAQPVSAWMVGPSCAMVRVEPPGADGRPRLVVAQRADGEVPRAWRAQAKGSTAVLVLGTLERHLMTLERPQVPDHELPMAVRWPAATAQDTDPDLLLCTPLALPTSNAAARDQLLVVSAMVPLVQQKLSALRLAGIDARAVDVVDSALLGMVRLHHDPHEACVALAPAGSSLCIGLMWQGRFCALRTLALPGGHPREDRDYSDHLALHIQRTVDLFERQATLLAIRQVMLALPSLSVTARETVASALPLPVHLFQLDEHLDIDPAAQAALAGDDDLQALAAVAVYRMLGDAPARVSEGEGTSSRDEVWTTAMAPPLAPPATAPVPDDRPAVPGEQGGSAGQRPSKPADEWALQP